MSPSLAAALVRAEREKLAGVQRIRLGVPFLDFFAGSGLVTEALRGYFTCVWANDICPKKRAVYVANHGSDHFHLKSITDVSGVELPPAILSWASFPCQDLSLAGKLGGISSSRSGLVWEWLRILDEMPCPPPLLVAENVSGLVSAAKGANYLTLHRALTDKGYHVGAVLLDAAHWLPQSRPRTFVIAVSKAVDVASFRADGPQWCHPQGLARALFGLDATWWVLPRPKAPAPALESLIDLDAPYHTDERGRKTLELIPPHHRERLSRETALGRQVFPGYKRTRDGNQVLELRFDGVSGCLRTARGGSSREFLVVSTPDGYRTRLLTVREAARLMGAPDMYKLPGSYNDAYSAMGDAVAVPVVRHLAAHLLSPLAAQVLEGQCDCSTSSTT